jgi:hypothetical protein
MTQYLIDVTTDQVADFLAHRHVGARYVELPSLGGLDKEAASEFLQNLAERFNNLDSAAQYGLIGSLAGGGVGAVAGAFRKKRKNWWRDMLTGALAGGGAGLGLGLGKQMLEQQQEQANSRGAGINEAATQAGLPGANEPGLVMQDVTVYELDGGLHPDTGQPMNPPRAIKTTYPTKYLQASTFGFPTQDGSFNDEQAYAAMDAIKALQGSPWLKDGYTFPNGTQYDKDQMFRWSMQQMSTRSEIGQPLMAGDFANNFSVEFKRMAEADMPFLAIFADSLMELAMYGPFSVGKGMGAWLDRTHPEYGQWGEVAGATAGAATVAGIWASGSMGAFSTARNLSSMARHGGDSSFRRNIHPHRLQELIDAGNPAGKWQESYRKANTAPPSYLLDRQTKMARLMEQLDAKLENVKTYGGDASKTSGSQITNYKAGEVAADVKKAMGGDPTAYRRLINELNLGKKSPAAIAVHDYLQGVHNLTPQPVKSTKTEVGKPPAWEWANKDIDFSHSLSASQRAKLRKAYNRKPGTRKPRGVGTITDLPKLPGVPTKSYHWGDVSSGGRPPKLLGGRGMPFFLTMPIVGGYLYEKSYGDIPQPEQMKDFKRQFLLDQDTGESLIDRPWGRGN